MHVAWKYIDANSERIARKARKAQRFPPVAQ